MERNPVTDFNFDIWRLQSQGDMQGLVNLLRHASPDMRRRAAMALRSLGIASAIPALQTALVTESDTAVRTALISTLDYLFEQTADAENPHTADQRKMVHWIAQLSSDKPEQIIRAAQNLGDLKEKIASEALVLVFRNRNHSARVRLAAAEALIKLESAPIEVTLLAALRNPNWHTRRNAAGVLGQLHADWAVEPLAAALRDPQEIVRRTAYAALQRIDTPEARRAMEPPFPIANKLQTVTSEEHTVSPSTLPSESGLSQAEGSAKSAAIEPAKPSSAPGLPQAEGSAKPAVVEAAKTPEAPPVLPTPSSIEVQKPATPVPSEAKLTIPQSESPAPQPKAAAPAPAPDPQPVKTPETSSVIVASAPPETPKTDAPPATPVVSAPQPAISQSETPKPTLKADDKPVTPDSDLKKTDDPAPVLSPAQPSAPEPVSSSDFAIDEETQPVKPVLDEDVS